MREESRIVLADHGQVADVIRRDVKSGGRGARGVEEMEEWTGEIRRLGLLT